MRNSVEVLERKSGGISNSVFEGTMDEVKTWMASNTIIVKNRGKYSIISELDCQSKDEFEIGYVIRINARLDIRKEQVKEDGTLSTYSFVINRILKIKNTI